MSPKMKTRDVKMRSCRKNKTKETAPIKSPPMKTKPKRLIIEKILKHKRNVKSAPSASTASCAPTEGNKNAEMRSCWKNKTKETAPINSPLKMSEENESAPSASTASCAPTEGNKNAEMRFCWKNKTKETAPINSPLKMTKKMSEENKIPENELSLVHYLLNHAYKESIDYENLMKKNFNTGFIHETPRRCKIYTPVKGYFPKWKENSPIFKHTKNQLEPGEKYANIFMNMPIDSDEEPDSDEETVKTKRKTRKRRRKKVASSASTASRVRNEEKERKKAEKQRKKAEKEERKKAEKERKKAEKERIKAEKEEFKNAEKKRKEAEREIKTRARLERQMMKYSLVSYKHSVDYQNLKKKIFNTGFINETPRRHEIQIYTEEELNDPKWNENVPEVRNTITGEPGEKYANVFMDWPIDLSDMSEEEVEEKKIVKTKGKRGRKKEIVKTKGKRGRKKEIVKVKTKGKRGRKKEIGYKGVPFSDECMLLDLQTLLYSPGCSK